MDCDYSDKLCDMFKRHAKKEGDKYKLNKQELKNLIQEEILGGMTMPPGLIDKIMADFDKNQDNEVEFHEFLQALALASQQSSH